MCDDADGGVVRKVRITISGTYTPVELDYEGRDPLEVDGEELASGRVSEAELLEWMESESVVVTFGWEEG